MARRKRGDTRLAVARYQVDQLRGPDEQPDEPDTAGQITMDARDQYVEIRIQQAMRSGDFDNLPGAGKPLTGLNQVYDPDWWIRRKIERDNLTGLGPPALTLRSENAALDARIAAITSVSAVRELLEDFNSRVIEARRQLLGGPPVVTPTRDIGAEIAQWRAAREAASAAASQTPVQTGSTRRRSRRSSQR